MKINLILALAFILIVALPGVGVYYFYQKKVISPTRQASPTPSTIGKFPSATSSASPPSTLPEAGFNTATIKNIGISITSPHPNETITSPIKVTGFANVFEGLVAIRVKDETGHVLGKGEASACMDLESCPFEASVVFTKPKTSTGIVEVFSPLPSDGSEYLKVVSVRF